MFQDVYLQHISFISKLAKTDQRASAIEEMQNFVNHG